MRDPYRGALLGTVLGLLGGCISESSESASLEADGGAAADAAAGAAGSVAAADADSGGALGAAPEAERSSASVTEPANAVETTAATGGSAGTTATTGGSATTTSTTSASAGSAPVVIVAAGALGLGVAGTAGATDVRVAGAAGRAVGNEGDMVGLPDLEPPLPDYEAASASRPAGIGPCGDTFVDYECDVILDPCPKGMHRDFDPADPCGICVDDPKSPLLCEAARKRYLQMLDHVISASCADFCETDDDCFVIEIDNACASGCSYALFGGIDEEILIIAEQFSAESCEPVCADTAAPSCAATGATTAACVDNRCVLQAPAD